MRKLILTLSIATLYLSVEAQTPKKPKLKDTTVSLNSYYMGVGLTSKMSYYTFGAYNLGSAIITISSPDSSGTYTVKFDRRQVRFINDSTFTFKIKK